MLYPAPYIFPSSVSAIVEYSFAAICFFFFVDCSLLVLSCLLCLQFLVVHNHYIPIHTFLLLLLWHKWCLLLLILILYYLVFRFLVHLLLVQMLFELMCCLFLIHHFHCFLLPIMFHLVLEQLYSFLPAATSIALSIPRYVGSL